MSSGLSDLQGFSYTESQRREVEERLHYTNEFGATLKRATDTEKEAYYLASQAFLKYIAKESNNEQTIFVDFSPTLNVATYIHPLTEKRKVFDLFEEQVPQEIKVFFSTFPNYTGPSKGIRSGSKGDASSFRTILDRSPSKGNKPNALAHLPLQREDAYSKVMPKLLREKPTRDARIKVSLQFLFADFMRQKMIQELDEKIKNLAPNRALHSEVERLRKVRRELEDVDMFALSHILAVQSAPPLDRDFVARILQDKANEMEDKLRVTENPSEEQKKEVGSLRELIKKADNINFNIYAFTKGLDRYPLDDGVLGELNPIRKLVADLKREMNPHLVKETGQQVWELLGGPKQDLCKEEIEYIQDAVGVLFTNRWDYCSYCSRECIQMKQEGVIDILYREAVSFADNDRYNGTGFEKSALGKFFEPGFFNGISRHITKQIENIDDDSFEFEVPVGITRGALAKHQAKQEEKLRVDLEILRGQLGWNVKI